MEEDAVHYRYGLHYIEFIFAFPIRNGLQNILLRVNMKLVPY